MVELLPLSQGHPPEALALEMQPNVLMVQTYDQVRRAVKIPALVAAVCLRVPRL